MSDKEKEAEKAWKKASKYCLPSVLDLRFKPDWDAACPLLERAAMLWKQCGNLKKAKIAYEKAAMAQEKLGSVWHAAKHLEICGDIAKQQQEWEEVSIYFERAAQLYTEGGKGSTGADSMVRGAKILEDHNHEAALDLYRKAIALWESEDKESRGADGFRSAIAFLIKVQNWPEAATMLVKFGTSCEAWKATASQRKAYLGAIVVWLHARDGKQAWNTYQDCLGVDSFATSDEAFAAEELLDAYRSGKEANVQQLVQTKLLFKNLDHSVARLALKLPRGDVAAVAKDLGGIIQQHEDEEEEDELT